MLITPSAAHSTLVSQVNLCWQYVSACSKESLTHWTCLSGSEYQHNNNFAKEQYIYLYKVYDRYSEQVRSHQNIPETYRQNEYFIGDLNSWGVVTDGLEVLDYREEVQDDRQNSNDPEGEGL